MEKYYYVSEKKVYGIDTRGNVIILKPFEKLRIIEEYNVSCIVKKVGKGQRRKYWIYKNDLFESPYCTEKTKLN